MKRAGGAGVRFVRVELDYGRHSTAFDLSTGRQPFVIEGPNGTGKSSLMEALVRTLYGFRRGRRDERAAFEARRPWDGTAYRGAVTLLTAQGEWRIERDFETDRVTITPSDRSSPIFEGEANPTRAGETARTYRTLLRDAVGLSDLDHYLRTACVFQGGLGNTKLNLDLLRVAAGGHTDVESAQARLQKEYRGLTTQPISPASSKRRKLGVVEELEAEAEDLTSRARAARAAEENRGPLVRAREEQRETLDSLGVELAGLEAAFETLSEARRLEEAGDSSRARLRRIERTTRELDEAMARLDLVRDRLDRGPKHVYPDDFLERARALEEGLWPREVGLSEELERLRQPVRSPTPGAERFTAPVGVVLLAAGILAWVFGVGSIVVAPIVLGVACVALWIGRRRSEVRQARERHERRREVERDLDSTRKSIERLLEGLPEARTLTDETLPDRRKAFAREAADRSQLRDTEQALRMAMDVASRELSETPEDDENGDENHDLSDFAGGLTERARELHRVLHEAAAKERDERLAPLKLQLGEIGRVRFDLPGDVDPSVDGVRAARRACLERIEDGREELGRIEHDLAVEGRPEASALELERQLSEVEARLSDRLARADAYRAAFALVGEAYESFRRTDEERLTSAVSGHLQAVSDGALGPLDASGGLEEVQVAFGERLLPVATPPLSYGQLHIALLSIRMGAADFLAGLGVQLPLLIDDPFMHLDERTAAELWRILEQIARTRQVIVATQDRLVLDHLGVAADLRLEAAEAVESRAPVNRIREHLAQNGAERTESRAEEPPAGDDRVQDELPDLWSQLDDG